MLIEQIANELQCAICLSLLTIPYVLRCGHSFCRNCIQNYGKAAKSTKCPLCKMPFNVNKINLNVSLQQVLNLLDNDSNTTTTLSRKKSTSSSFFICTSNISDEYKEYLEQFLKQFKIKTNSNINPRVTHLIAGQADSNNQNIARRTMKYLQAVARGIWIVNIQWVIESLKCDKIVNEEEFEMQGDDFSQNSAKISRLRGGLGDLLEDYEFYVDFCHNNTTISSDQIESLIQECGGTLTSHKQRNNITIIIKIVQDPQLNSNWKDCNPIQVNQRWLFDSICKNRVQSFYYYQI